MNTAIGRHELSEAEELVEIDLEVLGGEPVLKGTRLPVYTLVAMLDAGATPKELVSGYINLTDRKLELARLWVEVHPRSSPRKSLFDFGFIPVSTTRRPLTAEVGPDCDS